MTTQFVAAIISFAGIAALIGVFLFVLLRTSDRIPYEAVQPQAYAIRKRFFILLLIGFVLVPALTLRSMPYSADAAAPGTTVVDVTAHQWYWTLSREEVPVNQPVVFRVGSEDVNHGFGIYTEGNRLLAQVQAMPGYVNELAYQFDSVGRYKIMCLEYCGLAHHGMLGVFTVVGGMDAEETL
jgi:cytochrome c oxidase subunit 2